MTDLKWSQVRPPFYLFEPQVLRTRIQAIRDGFQSRFPSLIIGYSYKTNYVPYMLRLLHGEGVWAEVVSEHEYQLARRLDVPPERIIFNGPNKSYEALDHALRGGSLIHLDSMEEVAYVLQWRKANPQGEIEIGLRVNLVHPEREAHQANSRFGLTLEQIKLVTPRFKDASIRLTSLHAHLSSRARDERVFGGLLERLCEAAHIVGTDELKTVDVGGGMGFAPPGMPGLRFPSFAQYAETCWRVFRERAPALCKKTLIIEPGIAMCGDCFSYFAPVMAVKKIAGRKQVFVDGSVHTVKPTKHRHNLPTTALDGGFRPKSGPDANYDIVGYTCMDDDFIGIDCRLPRLEPGDVLRFDNVGAYTIVFKPPFIRTMPAILAREGDGLRKIRREESFEDFFQGYLMEAEPHE